MSYEETTEYLFNQTANYEKQGPDGYKPGLGNMLELDEHYRHPHRHYRIVHVTGTNGKGSVSHTLAALLQVCGYRVGLYTSPHLLDFSERIRVDGKPIPHDYVVDFVEKGRKFWDTFNPTFFEITTMMAFQYFKDADIDVAVVEVGLGGRLDSTNIVSPILSVITNVSLEHTDILGNTLEQIAREKGGIIKPHTPVVIGETLPETRPVFAALAEAAEAPIVFADEAPKLVSAEPTTDGFLRYTTKHGMTFTGELTGYCQEKNTNTILHAIEQLVKLGLVGNSKSTADFELTVKTAFSHVCGLTGLQGRWQKVQTRPTVICDIGHNTGGWRYLSRQLAAVACRHKHIVFGMVGDKDIAGVMQLLPIDATYYYTKGSTKRALPETALKAIGEQFGLTGNTYPTVEEAYKEATRQATPDDFIFVGGSNYIVADFLKIIAE